jgi:anti-sigma factor RsiW
MGFRKGERVEIDATIFSPEYVRGVMDESKRLRSQVARLSAEAEALRGALAEIADPKRERQWCVPCRAWTTTSLMLRCRVCGGGTRTYDVLARYEDIARAALGRAGDINIPQMKDPLDET